MSTQTEATTVTARVMVEVAPERAFQAFTAEIERWWPDSHHILAAPLARIEFQTHEGGGIIDHGTDGSQCRWADVLAFNAPHRLVFSWNMTPAFGLEGEPARRSEVEVRFTAESADRTLVELEHRQLDRHGEGWEKMASAVGSPDGWQLGLDRFADHAKG